MAMTFPLITQQMFAGMTYKWALTLWALLSAAMAPTPWVGNFALIARSRGFERSDFDSGPFLLWLEDPLSEQGLS